MPLKQWLYELKRKSTHTVSDFFHNDLYLLEICNLDSTSELYLMNKIKMQRQTISMEG